MDSGRKTIRYLESDSDWSSLISHLRDKTPLGQLNSIDAHHVFRHLRQLGYSLREPDRHPSGLSTTEAATTQVIDNNFGRLHVDANGRRMRGK
jgi:hypothetical protein